MRVVIVLMTDVGKGECGMRRSAGFGSMEPIRQEATHPIASTPYCTHGSREQAHFLTFASVNILGASFRSSYIRLGLLTPLRVCVCVCVPTTDRPLDLHGIA